MIGEKAYQNAMKRRAELRQELDDIETFLRLCERFAGLPARSEQALQEQSASAPESAATDAVAAPDLKTVTGTDLLPYVRKMALDRGKPVSRNYVKNRLPQEGLRINAKDPSNYIGTVLWRARDQFVFLRPWGYWPKDVPFAPAGYDPSPDDDSSDEEQSDREIGDTHSDEPPRQYAAKGA